jgi:hypothetical protein
MFVDEGFLELWRPLVPPWILQHVLDQLVLVRLQVNLCSCVPFSLVDPEPDQILMFSGLPDPSLLQAKHLRKILIFTILCLLFDFLSLKTDVNVPEKSNKQQKNLKKNTFFDLVASDEKSRIRIRILIQKSVYRSPDPYKNVMDPQRWVHTSSTI